MRICLVTPEFPTEEYISGGLAQVTYRKAKWMAREGHDVHVIISSRHVETFKKEGFWIHQINIEGSLRLRIFRLLTLHRLDGTLYWISFSAKVWLILRRLERDGNFDVVESSNYRFCGLFATLFLRGPAHALFAASYRPAWNEKIGTPRTLDVRILEWIEAIYYRLSKNIYSPSRVLKDMLKKELKLKRIEVLRIPFYVETSDLDRALYDKHLKNKSYLLFFGRLQLHKGPHILAQALPALFAAYPDVFAVFIGPDAATRFGPSMREYVLNTNYTFKDRLIFLEQVSHDKLYPIIAKARLVVLPSLVDNLPNVLLEAMGLGRPVVGTYTTSFDEIIEDGVNGFLVPPGDREALSKKIIEAWSRGDLDRVGEAARRKIEELAPKSTIGALLEYYKRAAH